jgi:uncharacterized tellurite resistance protein B-like protein
MFADLLRRLTDPAPAPLADTDARLALGALLVRLARSDGDYAAIEVARIDAILSARYGLSDPSDLRADCERSAEENSLMRMIAPMLGVTDQDSNAARIAIEASK